jgi:hypothetical protein
VLPQQAGLGHHLGVAATVLASIPNDIIRDVTVHRRSLHVIGVRLLELIILTLEGSVNSTFIQVNRIEYILNMSQWVSNLDWPKMSLLRMKF